MSLGVGPPRLGFANSFWSDDGKPDLVAIVASVLVWNAAPGATTWWIGISLGRRVGSARSGNRATQLLPLGLLRDSDRLPLRRRGRLQVQRASPALVRRGRGVAARRALDPRRRCREKGPRRAILRRRHRPPIRFRQLLAGAIGRIAPDRRSDSIAQGAQGTKKPASMAGFRRSG